MKTIIVKYCRELISLFVSVYSEHFPPFLGILTLLSFLPAFLYGCNVPHTLPEHDLVATAGINTAAADGHLQEIDIFVFRNDMMQKLDCYQKVMDPYSWNKEVVSRSGERIIIACANSGRTVMDWAMVSSLAYFRNISWSLENESPEYPFMSGFVEITAGTEGKHTELILRPLTSTVELRSIRCDFTGRPYDGELLKDVKVYLTNVNAECRIMDSEAILPSRVINAGRLCEEDINTLRVPQMLVRSIGQDIGKSTLYPDIRLWCYPNNSISESPGTPFTRLVIEGSIGGETFYWPLDINRDAGGYGIGRNERYVFDLTITRKGTKDPDIPIKTDEIDIIFNIETWNEKEDYGILF